MRILILKSKSKGGISAHIQHIIKGLQCHKIEFKVVEVSGSPLKIFINALKLRQVVKDFKPNIVHLHGYKVVLYSLFIESEKAKKVITFHGFLDGKKLKDRIIFASLNPLLKYLLKKVDQIVCVSQKLADVSMGEFQLRPDKVKVIYNGVKTYKHKDTVKKRDITKEHLILGACGRLTHAKGFDILLEAFNNIKGKYSVELHILGDGPDLSKLKALAGDYVYFHGFKENPLDYMKDFDVFLQPSRSEGCGIAVLEAMSLDLPVLVSDAGGLPELVKEGVHGLIFKKEDIHDLTKCLTMLLSNKELYRGLGLENKKWVEKHFSITNMLSKTLSLYEEMMGEEVYEEIL